MSSRLHAVAFALAACLGFAACTGDPVVLADIPEGDAGPRRPPPSRCLSTDDCPAGLFCEKRACQDPAGECRPLPITCASDEAPTCGCDGVTYFNDCLRRAAGASAATPGECGASSITCESAADCPRGGSCARLAGPDGRGCGPALRGTCWLVPATCPGAPGPDRWEECLPPPPPPPAPPPPRPPCVDTCRAIRSGAPHRRELDCGGR